MPKEITHWILAEKAYRTLETKIGISTYMSFRLQVVVGQHLKERFYDGSTINHLHRIQ